MAHTYSNVLIHGLFSTKDRRPLLNQEVKTELFPYMGGIIRKLGGKSLLINGPVDHVHLLFVQPTTVSLADFIEKVKSNSSGWVKECWPERRRFAWQTGYTAFSVSQSHVEKVRRYIERQEQHHRKVSFQEEVLAFLKRHGIAYDARFLLG